MYKAPNTGKAKKYVQKFPNEHFQCDCEICYCRVIATIFNSTIYRDQQIQREYSKKTKIQLAVLYFLYFFR